MTRGAALALAMLAIAIAIVWARPAPTTGPALRDFESYYAAGVTWRYHGDPYGRDVWRTERTIPAVDAGRDELLPFVGPPFGLPLWNAFGNLPWPLAASLWGALLALALGTIAFGSLRLARVPVDALDSLAVVAVVAGFGPLTSGIALGQVAIVSCAAIVSVPLVLGPRRVFAAAAAALLAALQPNLALALAARVGSRRAWIAFTFAAAVAVGGSVVALGSLGGLGHYGDVLRAHAAAERFLAIQTTIPATLRALGASAAIAGLAGLVVAMSAVVVVAIQSASGRYAPNDRLALSCAALPLIVPFAHEHDFSIAFFPALLAARRAHGATWVLAACGLLVTGVDWLGLAQRPSGALETILLTLAAALGLIVFTRERLVPYHVAPLGIALIVAVAAHVAAGHPLSTWPDALGRNFHVRFDAPAAAVWHAEQVHSGIAALVPTWGALRAASLFGCLLVWTAASIALRLPATAAATAQRSATLSTRHRPPEAAYPSDSRTS